MGQPMMHPGQILEISGGYWRTCALHTAVALDLFTTIGNGQVTADAVASDGALVPDATMRLLNALVAMDLLEKQGDAFSNSETAKQFLSRDSDRYIGYIIRHHHHLMESWNRMGEAIRDGGPIRERSPFSDEERRESFLMGMFNIASQMAPKVADVVDLGNSRHLLDLGGGPGTYAIHFCLKHPNLTATVYDLPTTRPFAEKTIRRFGLEDRIRFYPGDYTADPIEGDFDVAWLSHILHGEGPDMCREMIGKSVGALSKGGKIFIHEFILDDNGTGPLFPALFSLNMLLGTENGRSYTESELSEMLNHAGASDITRLPFMGPTESGIMMANV